MTEKYFEKIREKINRDYDFLMIDILKMKKQDIVNAAYRIAHYNEIVDFFDNIDTEYPPLGEKAFRNILNYRGNAILRIFDGWLNYNHPERYNFFCYEDLTDIIEWEFQD